MWDSRGDLFLLMTGRPATADIRSGSIATITLSCLLRLENMHSTLVKVNAVKGLSKARLKARS